VLLTKLMQLPSAGLKVEARLLCELYLVRFARENKSRLQYALSLHKFHAERSVEFDYRRFPNDE